MEIDLIRNIGIILLIGMFVSLILALILFFFAIRRLRNIDIPPHAGFAETLLYTPLSVVIFIDLLDFAKMLSNWCKCTDPGIEGCINLNGI